MTTTELIRDTDELIRRIMIRESITVLVLCALIAGLVILIAWLYVAEHNEKMRQLRQTRRAREEAYRASNAAANTWELRQPADTGYRRRR